MDLQPTTLPCPVCTLYLREGMSMQSHLNTHPKEQVIEALIKLYTTPRPPVFSEFSQQAVINPFQFVSSEEHIFLGRQQVSTNVIHTPFMGFPVYLNQHFLGATSEYQYHSHVDSNSAVPTPQADSESIVTMLNYQEQNEDYNRDMNNEEGENMQKIVILPDADVKEKHSISSSPAEPANRPHSTLSHYSENSFNAPRSDLAGLISPGPSAEEDVDDPEYLPETADFCDERFKTKEVEEDSDNEFGSSGLNIEANEKMPPKGELSGQGSVGNTMSSVWLPESPIMPAPLFKDDIKRKYACLYCSEEFFCPKERRIHVATLHCGVDARVDENGGIFKESMCLKCGLQVGSAAELKVHMRSTHKKISRKCNVCSEEFSTDLLYTEHLTHVHPLECRTCGKTFNNKVSLYNHAKIHLDVKPYSCSICPKTFITNQKLKEHMNGHTGYAPLECNLCDKKFRRYSNLKQHKDAVHSTERRSTKEYFCECGETFLSKKKLLWHKEIHELKPKQCMYCTERYIHSASLTRHIRRKHDGSYLPDSGRKNVSCPVCSMVCMDNSLKNHLKLHGHGALKHYGCIVCGKRFINKWNLTLHKWTHASRLSKPFKCTMCKGAFVRHSELQSHVRAHYGVRPYTCNHCGRQFYQKQNWQRHEREHVQEKSFICGECGKAFHRRYYLTEHSRIHTGHKPYTCHICNKTSATKSNHNKHVRTHHAREAVNTES